MNIFCSEGGTRKTQSPVKLEMVNCDSDRVKQQLKVEGHIPNPSIINKGAIPPTEENGKGERQKASTLFR